jgi:hypothetical protein
MGTVQKLQYLLMEPPRFYVKPFYHLEPKARRVGKGIKNGIWLESSE